MNAIAGIDSKHLALLDEYRRALNIWSETRALYVADALEVQEATKHLEAIEGDLTMYGVPALAGGTTLV